MVISNAVLWQHVFQVSVCVLGAVQRKLPEDCSNGPKHVGANIIYFNVCSWADKFCLHGNIFIYIRHIRIKPVLCSRMVSLFHHTSP